MTEIVVYDQKGKKTGKLEPDKVIFDGRVNRALIWQAVHMYQANQRAGTASTKVRSEVSGGGRKPWRQKGTGRARFGSIRNPIWRGGGVYSGPKPRDYSYSLPAKARARALQSGLNLKLKEERIKLLEGLELSQAKTKEFAGVIKSLKVNDDSALFLVEERNQNLFRASRNIPKVDVRTIGDFNLMDILRREHLVVVKAAFEKLTKALKGKL